MNNRFKLLRTHLKLSQEEFGNKLGLTRGAVTNIEYGKTEPKEHFISLTCKIFNVNEVWLRTGEGEMFLPEDRDNALMAWVGEVLADESDSFRRRYLNVLRSLTPDDWKRMEAYAEALLLNRPDP